MGADKRGPASSGKIPDVQNFAQFCKLVNGLAREKGYGNVSFQNPTSLYFIGWKLVLGPSTNIIG